MQSPVIRYQDVVDQIILRLNGRDFAEQAFYELYSKCHEAVWDPYQHQPRFERKKDTIQFKTCFCGYDDYLKYRKRGYCPSFWAVSPFARETALR